jgi:hypothetical protein
METQQLDNDTKNPILTTGIYSSPIPKDWIDVLKSQKKFLLSQHNFLCVKCKKNNVDKITKNIGTYKTIQLLYRKSFCNDCV